MNPENLKQALGKADVYVIDQFMKSSFSKTDKILDAGCGTGRNLKFLHYLGYNIAGCDMNNLTLLGLQSELPNVNLQVANLNELPFAGNKFDYVICNAVLHFANSVEEFKKMILELHRILKPNATLFIRMNSVFGIEDIIQKQGEKYLLPDGSHRFLLNNGLITFIKTKFVFKEHLKTVNVDGLRCMSNLVLGKV
jgi:tellurite methyltransferase